MQKICFIAIDMQLLHIWITKIMLVRNMGQMYNPPQNLLVLLHPLDVKPPCSTRRA